MSPTPEPLDALAFAKRELAAAAWPIPEDFLGDVGPLSIVWYLDQVGWASVRHYTAMLSAAEEEDDDPESGPKVALNALLVAVGALDQACVALGLIDAIAAATP